jgi:AraC-like DNA-binding protein
MELMLEGCVYRLLGEMLEKLAVFTEEKGEEPDYSRVKNIERALDLIYYNYKNPITVDDAAAITGYSKSNFCKIFKLTVGEGFHQALNRRRVDNATAMLKVTDASISEIANQVGFCEAKAFCRVFKDIMGVSPGQYRKENKQII